MNLNILNTKPQEFINENINSDITSLLLKGTAFKAIETREIIEQIEAKKRCKTKLANWFNTKNIYFPNKLNIEQTSSEVTAEYKANLISGHSIIDLTGGFGVDCYYFSKQFSQVTHCEINKNLSKIVCHNYKQLQVNNIETIDTDGISYLKDSKRLFDWIYVDPSRRHESKGKVFFLKDCLPNIPEHLDALFNCANNVMIKTAPLLDLSVGLNELNHVKTIHVVALNNDVKELLWVLEKGYSGKVDIQTVNIKKDKQEHFSFNLEDELNKEANYSLPLSYLCEPNSAIMKSGAFNTIANKLSLFKLHKHSHLYTSEQLIEFPGRTFKIDSIITYNKKTIKKLGINKANITTRNFPDTVQQIRRKLAIKDGGSQYLFFTTDLENNKIVIISSKL